MSEIGIIAYNIALVILGINALIIVHEWGHFIVARACGVRCEKFYIWFDFWGLKFFKFKWGDTEYGLGLFPLGGYVKMLGQEDNPGELRREMERAKIDSNREPGTVSPEGSPVESQPDLYKNKDEWTGEKAVKVDANPDALQETPNESPNESLYAPDSFLAKSVPQRLAIIVAGVVMNFLFAIICAAGAYMVGIEDTAPAVGSVVPGSPAWDAGLEIGDKILSINGGPARVFMDINMAMVGNEGGVKLSVQRNDVVWGQTIVPRKRAGDIAPMIGVGSLPTLELASEETPVDPELEPYYDEQFLKAAKKPKLRLASVNGNRVTTYRNYMNAQLQFIDKPVPVELLNPNASELVVGELPVIPMRETGLRFRMGTVVNVLPNSGAAAAGIVAGDRILAVDGQTDIDPLKLPQIILHKVNAGQTSVELTLQKNGAADKEQTVTVTLQNERLIPELGFLSMKDPVGSTALGLTWGAEPVIEAFHPAEESKIRSEELVGKRVFSVKLLHAGAVLRNTSFCFADEEGVQFVGVGDKVDVPFIFDKMLQSSPTKKSKKDEAALPIVVRLGIEDEKGEPKLVDLPLYDSADWFNANRGLLFKTETAVVKITNIGEALQLGTAKMVEYSLSVFQFLEALGSGTVSPRALSGPVGIVSLAYRFADNGMGSYLLFLCMIGANLAVINILPIPVLDGGHVVFLLYEGITGRVPNETFQVIVSYIGLALILALMVWVVALDVSCIARF